MIDRDEVLRIAALARLELTDDEVVRMARDLGRILEYVERLAALPAPARGAEPAASTPRRPDVVVPSRLAEELLALAPEREDPLVRVPRVVE
ncbi:MAG TPA: Asp-tRNA(Asn)/Glu-tRNA(Gln) amidotransferase subunit GatC [Gemmatimonadota bacterium]|jgi:aspartyl-tRNA(Asn)/glutamyl-tRNA(Gln) amidotransferase subunit C